MFFWSLGLLSTRRRRVGNDERARRSKRLPKAVRFAALASAAPREYVYERQGIQIVRRAHGERERERESFSLSENLSPRPKISTLKGRRVRRRRRRGALATAGHHERQPTGFRILLVFREYVVDESRGFRTTESVLWKTYRDERCGTIDRETPETGNSRLELHRVQNKTQTSAHCLCGGRPTRTDSGSTARSSPSTAPSTTTTTTSEPSRGREERLPREGKPSLRSRARDASLVLSLSLERRRRRRRAFLLCDALSLSLSLSGRTA